jgi:N-acetylated-alpha-linked acidic dipeptidase
MVILAADKGPVLRGDPADSMPGFSPASAAREEEAEQAFRRVPTPSQAEDDIRTLSRQPHVASTPQDYDTVRYVQEQFRAAGLGAKIVPYEVMLPFPKEVRVDLVAPVARDGPSPESAPPGDPDPPEPGLIPAYNAFSPSADVTAPVVYANYGLPEDYDRLAAWGVDVAGKIVIVRYGRCFRGVKAYVAQEHHAAGLLIYSDPADDGSGQGEIYPQGPWRPESSVQQGSILYLTQYIGDPLTPGIAATPQAKRLTLSEASIIPRIPTTPLSAKDAQPVLQHLEGHSVPSNWQGGLPFTYHVGPGASKVRLKLDMDYRLRTIWDVVAVVPGTSEPDHWVILGNHRDAWVYGAADPASGTAPLLAVARGLGSLLRQGWRPKRSIVLASWDGEEFGLMGSTEWAEEHTDLLEANAVAYLNIDVGVTGKRFGSNAVPSLRHLIRDVTQDVIDPASGLPLSEVWAEESKQKSRKGHEPSGITEQVPSLHRPQGDVGDLGSGSDYTPFLQHLGVPSLDFGFSGQYGVYHSRFDDFAWMQRFGDPTFRYSVAAAQVYGTLALRLADADILPYDFEECGQALQKYVLDLGGELNGSDPADSLSVDGPARAARGFSLAAARLSQQITKAAAGGLSPARLNDLNFELLQLERSFLLDRGLPGRPWFRHALYAPGVYTGYTVEILPGVRTAEARHERQIAREQLKLLRVAIDRGTATLRKAQGILETAREAGE